MMNKLIQIDLQYRTRTKPTFDQKKRLLLYIFPLQKPRHPF